MDFEPAPEHEEAVTRAMASLANLDRGDLLLHGEASRALQAPAGSELYYYLMRRVKAKLLASRGIELWPEAGVGYRLCTKGEQLVTNARKRQLRAKRQLLKSQRALESLPAVELSKEEAELRMQQLGSLSRQQKDMAQRARWLQMFGQSE